MWREERALCQVYGKSLTVDYLLVYCRNHMETKKTLEIPNNPFEDLSPVEDNINKIISFLRHIITYDLI